MSNTWEYTLIFKDLNPVPVKIFTAAIRGMKTAGYSLWLPPDTTNPNQKRLDLQVIDDRNYSEIMYLAKAEKELRTKGGTLVFWKIWDNEKADVNMHFRPEEGEISIAAPHDLRKNNQQDVNKAGWLKEIFINLCMGLGPLFGYSSDKWGFEAALKGKDVSAELDRLRSAVRGMKQPPLLCWMNYFSSIYFRKLDRHIFENVFHKKEKMQSGVLLTLAEYPWENMMAAAAPNGHYKVVK
jgi:hypothetical protein